MTEKGQKEKKEKEEKKIKEKEERLAKFKKTWDSIEEKTIIHNGLEYKIVQSPQTGRIWLDRNLGAKRVCKSLYDEQCFGDYFQWGRTADGHEKKYSKTTSSLSNSTIPSHNKFILIPYDRINSWSKTLEKLWQKSNGKNNPCPSGFRVPSKNELQKEITSNNIENSYDANKSFLKIGVSGIRQGDGVYGSQGKYSELWTNSYSYKDGSEIYTLHIGSYYADFSRANRIPGLSVRCIKD